MPNWDQVVSNGTNTLTLRDFVRENYHARTDLEIADILTRCGFSSTPSAVKSLRRRIGWSKTKHTPKPTDLIPASEIVLHAHELEVVSPVVAADIDPLKLLKYMKNKPRTLRDISDQFDRSERTIQSILDALKGQHYNIVGMANSVLLSTKEPPDTSSQQLTTLADLAGMRMKMAWIADLHWGSTAQQITNFLRFVSIAYERGVRHVFIAGDIFAGHDVYRGQIYDLYAIGAAKQLAALRSVFPRYPEMCYYVLGGNHDYSFIKASGYDIMADFADSRDDVIYLGYDMADVPITDRIDIRMWHPHGGVPYALSYRLQKGLEQTAFSELVKLSGDEDAAPKVRGIISGHLHVTVALERGPIFAVQAGCFEGQTNLLKRMGRFPQISGYIVEWKITDGGHIQEVTPTIINFLEIIDDYRNYPDMLDCIGGSNHRPENPAFQWLLE